MNPTVPDRTVPGRFAGKTATAEQLAAAITWLASDDSANVTGIVPASDGWWSAI